MDCTHPSTGQESQAKTLPSATAEEMQGLTSNPENFLFKGPRLYYDLLSPQYTVLHILFYCTFYYLFVFLTYIYIYSLVLYFIFLHCPLSRPDLTYISLLIISCIIEYVTNKRTLNLEPFKNCRVLLYSGRN